MVQYTLIGSWVKLDETFRCGNERPFSIHNGEMENLLAEAADDKISTDRSQERRFGISMIFCVSRLRLYQSIFS